jgi:hypothetical protein
LNQLILTSYSRVTNRTNKQNEHSYRKKYNELDIKKSKV